MSTFLLFLSLPVAVVDWIAVFKKWKPLEYIAKPGMMLTLIVLFYLAAGIEGSLLWFALGFVFSLAGDIFLMLPNRQFVAGLVSFLLAHVAYITGFNTPLPQFQWSIPAVAVLIALVARQIYVQLSPGFTGENSRLRIPVIAYIFVISLMLFSALITLTRIDWIFEAALLASLGAVLFYVSDTIIAWEKFIRPVQHGRLLTMVTYHLAQLFIAFAAVIQFTM